MELQNPMQKPPTVTIAVNLLWLSMGVGLVKVLVDISNASATASATMTNFILALTFAVIAFLITKISVGRGWARTTFLIMFLIGMMPTLPLIAGEFAKSPTAGAVTVLQLGLQIYALYLLYTQPGSSWFQSGSET